jgi:hypothetical protein
MARTNIPRAAEFAMFAALSSEATYPAGTAIRVWQDLSAGAPAVDSDGSRTFPQVDIRCGPPVTDENQVTLYCDVELTCRTLNEEDKLHRTMQDVYEETQGTLDTLYAQWRAGGGALLTLFEFVFDAEIDETTVDIGGYSFQDGVAPYEDDGRNTIGMTFRIHYSRADY